MRGLRPVHPVPAFVSRGAGLLAAAVWLAGCDGATGPPGRPGGQITVGQITKVSGKNQSAAAGARLPESLVVRVFDTTGNPIAGAPVAFDVIAGGGAVEKGSGVTGPDGVASSGAWTLGATVGIQQVRAESGTLQVFFSALAYGPPTDLTGRITFVSDRDGDAEIYTIDADGSGLARLTRSAGLDDAPAWSPDGGRIAFVSDREGEPSVHVMLADGSDIRRLTDGLLGATNELAWSPGGSTIAFSTLQGEIALVENADGAVRFLTDDPGWDGQPSWSPDGGRLAFATDREFDGGDGGRQIYTMNADGTDPRSLTQGSDHPLNPAWSPDGSMIAFVRGSSVNGAGLRFTVAIMSADGMKVFSRDLTWAGDRPWQESPGSLTWSPDGRAVAYTFHDCDLLESDCSDVVPSVNYVSLDGSPPRTLVADARNPSWRP